MTACGQGQIANIELVKQVNAAVVYRLIDRLGQGLIKPAECPHFGNACRPERPLGAPMVSSEGACAAYYQYAALRDVG